jgi:hypothetical protein
MYATEVENMQQNSEFLISTAWGRRSLSAICLFLSELLVGGKTGQPQRYFHDSGIELTSIVG